MNGEKYAEEFELKTTKVIKDGSLRGNIYDCNGEILAYNKLVYTVTIVDSGDYSSERKRQLGLNGMLYKVIRKLEEKGEQLNNELKIVVGTDGNYEYTVTGKALERFKADVFGQADPGDMSEEQIQMSADEMICFLAGNSKFALYGEGKKEYSEEELREYGLPEAYTKEEVLNIVGIRYMLSLNAYRKYVPVVLAGDVSEETVAYIKENNGWLTGIDIGQEWERVYDGGEAFSHILGYVGKISAEELEEHEGSDKDYTIDSIVGKTGIEQLEITPAQLALDPCSASAVVVQEGTGQVLACVSYPGYDNNRLANQMDAEYYVQLLKDKSLPLYNRATQQLTAPGSTFKPITIIAGLQEGVISADTSVFCDGVFDKVAPPLRCWNHFGHGNVFDASTALQFSCNDYLCEISYRLGLTNGTVYDDGLALSRLQEYAALFHLDEKSGIEIDETMPHITDANGVLVESEIMPEAQIALPDSAWNTVKTGMVQYAQNNSVLKDMEICVAGKTGTAQESKHRPDHALFVGYAPAEVPEITVAVRIANGYSSSNAAAIGRNIFYYYFGYSP